MNGRALEWPFLTNGVGEIGVQVAGAATSTEADELTERGCDSMRTSFVFVF
jgi:hypothetical protein